MNEIHTNHAPQPAGHYAQGVVFNNIIYTSGQLSVDATTRMPIHGSIEDQLLKALSNVVAIVEAVGSSKNNILKCTVYISDIELWPKVNETYAAFFGNHKPARSVVPVSTLHHGLLVEVEAIAAITI